MKSKIDKNEGLLPAIIAIAIFALTLLVTSYYWKNSSFNENFFVASEILCIMCILWNFKHLWFTKQPIIENILKFSGLLFSTIVLLLIAMITVNPFYMLIEGILLLIIAGIATIIVSYPDTRD